jgi:DNA-binding NtrC family response regulator
MRTMEYSRATGSRLVGSRSVKSAGTEMPIIVLIVEDEALVREIAADVLRDAGFQVFEASNGHDALTLLASNPHIRVLFTDINMPGSIDGLMLASMASVRWPDLAIIVSSGNSSFESETLPGSSIFISKPYEFGRVIRLVREMTMVPI